MFLKIVTTFDCIIINLRSRIDKELQTVIQKFMKDGGYITWCEVHCTFIETNRQTCIHTHIHTYMYIHTYMHVGTYIQYMYMYFNKMSPYSRSNYLSSTVSIV